MTEHKICKGCKWNNYPTCKGSIMFNGSEMNIENLKPSFKCGHKDKLEVTDFSIKKKSALELKIEELEAKIKKLEDIKKI